MKASLPASTLRPLDGSTFTTTFVSPATSNGVRRRSLAARLAALAAGVCACVGVGASARAAIVYTDPPDIVMPADNDGVYLDVVTGQYGYSEDDVPNFTFNPYLTSEGYIGFYVPFGGGTVANADGYPTILTPGTLIGPSSVFDLYLIAPEFTVAGTELLGFRFFNENTGATNYGWAELTTVAGTGVPGTINRYAYDDSGAPIAAGAVPEPGSIAAMIALGLGAAGLRVLRRRR